MTLCARASKALAATAPHPLKVRLLLPLCSCYSSSAIAASALSETHYRDIIFSTIRKKPSAFSNSKWCRDRFQAVIADPKLFVRVLVEIRTRPRIALRFFRWVESQPEVKRSEFVFCVILEILVQNNMMRSAYWVMERVISVDMHGIVDVLIGEYVFAKVSIKLLDLLLWVYTKKWLVEECLSIFDKMIQNGLLPDVNNCNRVLRILRDKHLATKAKQVYRMMGEAGIKPTIVTYNIMLDSFCKQGEVKQALNLVTEMQKVGCFPNGVTYNVLINGLSKEGQLQQAEGLMRDMLKSGLRAS